jgi:16S rRNA (guanine527-N7)-methyltransferase
MFPDGKTDALKQTIAQGLAALNIPAAENRLTTLTTYIMELERWNNRYGFIKSDQAGLVSRHLLDSLAGLPLIQSIVPDGAILDFGSGAGFPGFPLAVFLPHRHIILCERKATERAFLNNMCLLLQLSNISVTEKICTMSENSLSAIVFRAVTSLATIYPLVHPYLSPGGFLFAYKGTREKIDQETEELGENSSRVNVYPVGLPEMERKRHIVTLRKD